MDPALFMATSCTGNSAGQDGLLIKHYIKFAVSGVGIKVLSLCACGLISIACGRRHLSPN